MEDNRRIPTTEEIDDSFRLLLGNQIVTVSNLVFLMSTHRCSGENNESSKRVQLFSEIVDRLIENVRNGYFKRWDFDPWDTRKDSQTLSSIAECDTESEAWICRAKSEVKRGLLTMLIRKYKQFCNKNVQMVVNGFDEAREYESVFIVLDQAINLGILQKEGSKMLHCHSIVNAKKAYLAFAQAQDRIYQ